MIGWPTSPGWLYAFTQGLHVTIGIIIVPLLLAKLWSVIPRLFAWPPVTGPVNALERIGILLLVGSGIFQFATGIANAQLYYPWHFDFVGAHYYGGLFIAALVAARRGQGPGDRAPTATRRAATLRARLLEGPSRRRAAARRDPGPGRSAAAACSALVGAAAGALR